MVIRWKPFIINILIPLVVVGGGSALLTMGSFEVYDRIVEPPLSPPSWLFPIVWTILFILMGIASYLVWESNVGKDQKRTAYIVYAAQLAVNFLWSILFFNFEAYDFTVFVIIVLLILIIFNIYLFGNIDKTAGWLLVPYLIWVSFATYLNFGIAIMN